MIAALARAHEWRLAERTFAEMKRAFPNHDPSVLVYTSLISAYGKGGQWEKAKGAFDALREAGTRVDTGVYNALLSAAVSAAEYREAARVFDRMPSEGFDATSRRTTPCSPPSVASDDSRDMETLRREMRKGGIEANETTFSVLITAHGNTGDCHRACKLLDEACDAPWVYKSAVVFNSALGACVKNGESRLAQRVLRLMRAEGIQPTLVTYNTMLMGASAERDWKGVTDTFRELLQSGQAPDAITLDCLCGIEKLQAAADARAEAEAAAARAVGADGDAEGADAEGADAEGADEAPARGALAANLDELCDLLRVVVDEEIVRNAGAASSTETPRTIAWAPPAPPLAAERTRARVCLRPRPERPRRTRMTRCFARCTRPVAAPMSSPRIARCWTVTFVARCTRTTLSSRRTRRVGSGSARATRWRACRRRASPRTPSPSTRSST